MPDFLVSTREALLALALAALPLAADATSAPNVPNADAELDFDPSSFDRGVDVCTDPYAYANNRWLQRTALPPDRPLWGPRYQVVERNERMQRELAAQAAADVASGSAGGDAALVGTFYAAGLDEAAIDAAGTQPIAADLARIDSIRTRAGLMAVLADYSANGVHLLFDYRVYPRGDDAARAMVYFEQGGLGIADRDRYLGDDAETVSLREAYRAHLVRLLELSGTASGPAQREAEAAFALETALARASLSMSEISRVENIYAQRPLADIRRIAPRLDLDAFLAAHGHAGATEASMAQPEFFREIERQLERTSLADWRSYLRLRLLDTLAPYLARAFAEQHFAFHDQAERGVQVPRARWRRVLAALADAPSNTAMGRLFVARHLPPEAKPRALAMIADLRAAFRARVERAAWMDARTRAAALRKLDGMRAKIGYPDRWPDLSALRYAGHDYVGNVRAGWRFAAQRDDAQLRDGVDRARWRSPAYEINARYDPQANEIVFPAPMLLAPAFDPTFDPALNYAVLGVVIGHEMTHGFDDIGAHFDADGRLRDWWSAKDKARFEALGARVAARYAALEIAPGRRVDGRLALGENIADLGGLAIAYDALERRLAAEPQPRIDGLAQEQRFFLRYASIWRNHTRPEFARLRLKTDPHAPDRLRALVPLAETPGFAAAFSCKPGSAMNRADAAGRVGVW